MVLNANSIALFASEKPPQNFPTPTPSFRDMSQAAEKQKKKCDKFSRQLGKMWNTKHTIIFVRLFIWRGVGKCNYNAQFYIIYDSLGYTHYLFSVNLSINTLTKRTPTPTHSPAGIQTKDNKVIAEKNQPQWPTEWCGKKLNYIFKHCNANFPTD